MPEAWLPADGDGETVARLSYFAAWACLSGATANRAAGCVLVAATATIAAGSGAGIPGSAAAGSCGDVLASSAEACAGPDAASRAARSTWPNVSPVVTTTGAGVVLTVIAPGNSAIAEAAGNGHSPATGIFPQRAHAMSGPSQNPRQTAKNEGRRGRNDRVNPVGLQILPS